MNGWLSRVGVFCTQKSGTHTHTHTHSVAVRCVCPLRTPAVMTSHTGTRLLVSSTTHVDTCHTRRTSGTAAHTNHHSNTHTPHTVRAVVGLLHHLSYRFFFFSAVFLRVKNPQHVLVFFFIYKKKTDASVGPSMMGHTICSRNTGNKLQKLHVLNCFFF